MKRFNWDVELESDESISRRWIRTLRNGEKSFKNAFRHSRVFRDAGARNHLIFHHLRKRRNLTCRIRCKFFAKNGIGVYFLFQCFLLRHSFFLYSLLNVCCMLFFFFFFKNRTKTRRMNILERISLEHTHNAFSKAECFDEISSIHIYINRLPCAKVDQAPMYTIRLKSVLSFIYITSH